MSFGFKFFQRARAARTKAEQAHRELQRDIALASMAPDHPQWQAVLDLVDEHSARETDGALAPNLNNDQRQYAAGAAATAVYLAEYLRDAKRLADERMAKRKAE